MNDLVILSKLCYF